ncbi:MAG: hypothetical protein LBT01_01050 [Spirochaetaceae bacterium]|jgi:hypothetical protein|nr:hypothetical protein [Spirochaetaceae bacterium]
MRNETKLILLVCTALTAFSACNAIADTSGLSLAPETVWIRLVPGAPFDDNGARTAVLTLDFSKDIPALKDDLDAAGLAELFGFEYDYPEGTPDARKIKAVGLLKSAVPVYRLTVINVPEAEEGIVLVKINKSGISPATRLWSLDGTILPNPEDITGYSIALRDADGGAFGSSGYSFARVWQEISYPAPAALSVTVENTGTQPTGPLSVVLSGSNADRFVLSANALDSIAVGGTAEGAFTVQPKTGLGLALYTATLTVSGKRNFAKSFTVSFKVGPPEAQFAAAARYGGNASRFQAVAKDADGFTYAVGLQVGGGKFNYGGSADAQATQATQDENVVISAVLVQYDSSGTAQWARVVQAPQDSGYSIFYGVAVDELGGIYVVGQQNAGIYTYSNGVHKEAANSSGVIAKYDKTGAAQWVTFFCPEQSQGSADFFAVAVDATKVYAAGREFTGGSGSSPEGAVICAYNRDTGVLQWTRSVDKSSSDDEEFAMEFGVDYTGVAADGAGNAYAVGNQTGTGEFVYGSVTLQGSQDGSNGVIVKYDESGTVCWAQLGGGKRAFSSVTADGVGGIYVAGADDAHALVVKYNGAGVVQWAHPSIGAAYFLAASADGLGNVYAAGMQQLACDYDGASATGSSTTINAVVVQYSGDTGAALWAQSVSGASCLSQFYGVAANRHGISAVGWQDGDETFGYGNNVSAQGTYKRDETSDEHQNIFQNAVIVGYR